MKKTTRKTAAPAPASFEIPAGYTLQTTVEHAVARLVLTAAPLAKTGGWRVKLALKATEHLDAALSATQLGITLASLGLGWVGEPFLAHRIAPLLAQFGVTDAGIDP